MTDVVIRPLVAGEENLFDSMPDPLPELKQASYAGGVASGGYRPEHTFIALRHGKLVARAAWLLPPGAVGQPWLERFDLIAEPEVGAALLKQAHHALGGPKDYYASMPADWRRRPAMRAIVETPMAAARLAGLAQGKERLRYVYKPEATHNHHARLAFRPAKDTDEVNALVARITDPDVLTGMETAKLVRGVDLATNPLGWLSLDGWRVAFDGVEPVGLAAAMGDACYPMIAYLGAVDGTMRHELMADAVKALVEGGALEVVADVDAERQEVQADLERQGFKPVRSRILFTP